MSYKHLSLEERYYIGTELRRGITVNSIAKALGRSASSILREIERNSVDGLYDHKRAHIETVKRHQEKAKQVKLTEEAKDLISEGLEAEWSPEQIAGRNKLKNKMNIHFITIYRFIYQNKRSGGSLYLFLRHPAVYRCKYGTPSNRSGNPGRVDIDERPEEANNRVKAGHWEADTMVGKRHKGVIVTIDERKSKLRLAIPVKHKRAEDVKDALIRLLAPIKDVVKTITFDNGKEFTQHGKIAEALGCDNYFAKPYHAWERGQNENANGLLRQYFPKSVELLNVTVKEVFKAVWKLNNRPRKCIGYKTPFEYFEELTGINVQNLEGYALMM